MPGGVAEYQKRAKIMSVGTPFESAGWLNQDLNAAALDSIKIRPRVLRDASNRDLSTTVLGQKISFPVMISPTGGLTMPHKDGELASARAAARSRTIMVVSTFSNYSMEEVSKESNSLWFNLYFLKDKDLTKSLIQRAEKSGYTAIVPVVDFSGATPYPATTSSHYAKSFGNFRGIKIGDLYESMDLTVDWSHIKLLKSITKLPIIVKGIQTAEDAKLCVEKRVDAIIVSNHDYGTVPSSRSTIDILPEIVEAVDDKIEIYLDGGITRGSDVFKALAVGAKCVLIGKAMLWGLAADGESGVYRVLESLRHELDFVMGRCGVRSVDEINRNYVKCTAQ
ncbi:MAG: alpha-hydroxy acid oxidase [Nitrososphaerales archaeon]